MPESKRKIVPYVPLYGAPIETTFSDTYVEVATENASAKSWNDLTSFNEGEYTYVIISREEEHDQEATSHYLHPNSNMEWWGTTEVPLGIFSAQRSPVMLRDVQQQIAATELNLLDTTTRVNVIFMNPEIFGINAADTLSQPSKEGLLS